MGVWAHDSWYSLNLYQRLGYDDQAVRLGFIHYNTADEVDALVGGAERAGRLRAVLRKSTLYVGFRARTPAGR